MSKQFSIRKEALKLTAKKFANMSVPLSIFAVLFILSLIAAYFVPLTLIITVPFLVIPSFFGLTGCSAFLSKKEGKEGTTFVFMFRSYFSGLFRGGYKVIIGLIFTIIIYIGISLLLSIILSNTVLVNDPGFIELRNAIQTITDVATLNKIVGEYLSNNELFNNVVLIISAGGLFVGVWYFIHHVCTNNIKYYNNLISATPLPIPDLNIIHKFTVRKVRGSFYKDYYGSLWLFLLLLPIGMVGGTLLGKLVIPNTSPIQCAIIGLFGIFVLTLFFIPYYLNVAEIIYLKYSRNYIETFVNLSLQSIEQLKKTQQIDPEKEKAVMEFLEKQKESIKDKEDKKEDK